MNSWEKIPQGTLIDVTFREAAAFYVAAGGESRYLNPRLLELIGEKRLSEIDQSLIDELASELFPTAASSTPNRQVYTPISAVLKFSAARGWCCRFRVKRPRQPGPQTNLPSSAEFYRFKNAAGPSLKRIALFLVQTGTSVRETLELEWHQVDLASHQMRLPPKYGGSARFIALRPRVVEMLAKFLHRNGRVFRRPDGHPYALKHDVGGQLKSAFRGACRRAGVARITPRTLRRIWASRRMLSDFDGAYGDDA